MSAARSAGMRTILVISCCLALAATAGCASAPDEAVDSADEAITWSYQRGLWGSSGETWVFDRAEASSALTNHAEAFVLGLPERNGYVDAESKGSDKMGPYVLRWKRCDSGNPCQLYETFGHYQVYQQSDGRHEMELRPSGDCR